MSKSVVVLAVPHQLQGQEFSGYVEDRAYSLLIQDTIKKGVGFVFEEASGRRPTTAENLVKSVLGPGHYLDVDPPTSERPKYGIANQSGGTCLIGDPCDEIVQGLPPDSYEWAIVEEHRKREELWLQGLQAQPFEKGLVICGLGHNLSFAFRLLAVGISVTTVYSYIPHHKLCNHMRVKSSS